MLDSENYYFGKTTQTIVLCDRNSCVIVQWGYFACLGFSL